MAAADQGPVSMPAMDRLEHALREFRRLLPDPARQVDDRAIRRIRIWMHEDVCPLLDDFCRRPLFREYASWPVTALAKGAGGEERKLVDRVDAALVNCAQEFVTICSKPSVRQRLMSQSSRKRAVREETVSITAEGSRRHSRRTALVDELGIELSQVQNIARHRRDDLVRVQDYFEPEQEFVRLADGAMVQWGEMIVSLNPELLPIGNFIVRSLLRRVDLRLETLRSVRSRLLAVLPSAPPRIRCLQAIVEETWSRTAQACGELRARLSPQGEMQLRDACVALTQVYAAFDESPDLSWLGLPEDVISRDLRILKQRLTSFQGPEMLNRIAAALSDLRLLYSRQTKQLAAVDEAIGSGALVINVPEGRAYWEGRPLDLKLRSVPGRLLRAMARKARHRSAATLRDVYGDDDAMEVTDSAMSTAADRLKRALKDSRLSAMIVRGGEKASYRLDVEPQRILIIER